MFHQRRRTLHRHREHQRYLPGKSGRGLKGLTRQQLEFAGWVDEVERQCRKIALESMHSSDSCSGESNAVRHATLLEGVRESALRSVPDHIKARVLKDIKDRLMRQS
jgi:hypothetical protein